MRAEHRTLVANTDTPIDVGIVGYARIINRTNGTEVFYSLDGTSPVPDADNTHCVMGLESVKVKMPYGSLTGVIVRSTATPKVSVEEITEQEYRAG